MRAHAQGQVCAQCACARLQRGRATLVGHLHARARVDEEGHARGIGARGGLHQRGAPDRSCRVDRCARAEQRAHRACVARVNSVVQRGQAKGVGGGHVGASLEQRDDGIACTAHCAEMEKRGPLGRRRLERQGGRDDQRISYGVAHCIGRAVAVAKHLRERRVRA